MILEKMWAFIYKLLEQLSLCMHKKYSILHYARTITYNGYLLLRINEYKNHVQSANAYIHHRGDLVYNLLYIPRLAAR